MRRAVLIVAAHLVALALAYAFVLFLTIGVVR